ncbi:valyl-tRNA synthetase [Erysipelotrichaceae bacterium]|nr:valyl-tRNA synthetase [Erysipelotrichaceae bacterium]
MKKELAQKYDHKIVEAGKYAYWQEENCFSADPKSTKEPFTIVIPPPNVTGKLHVGHAWDTAIQDLIIRMKRMEGYNALYLPGMDHAGIATQAKVEQRLRDQGISRHDLGRERFLEKVWEWKDEYADSIREQWEKMGLSLDYSKERFTLDEGLSKAVNKVFVDLYNKKFIYQGERIINWDPVQKTALSNIEVIYKDIEGAEHYFKYMFADGSGEYLTIMTTRPETMFGDGAIAVHPDDERYKDIVGKEVIVPITNKIIPVIADDYVSFDKGSGCVKITPAHDPNDFEVGKRHNIAENIIMEKDGTMSANEWVPLAYQGLDRFIARKIFVEDAHKAGLLSEVKPFIHSVGHSERSGAVVEPYLSKQWFVDMTQLAEEAIAAQLDDKTAVTFFPQRFEKTFVQWMEKVQDWCISRQLWWGHQIPAWYHKTTGEVYVSEIAPSDIENWEQDADVLDTWFSSALWPFSTMNWPATEDELFKKFFPNNVLVTGYDIIFFWVSRMIFQSLEFTKKRPFKDVLIHGLVRAEDGRKMSKSLDNGIDPMDVIEKYGADSLRYFLVTNTSPGQDVRYIEQKVEAAGNFANKIWNASRFVLLNNPNQDCILDYTMLDTIDEWILGKLNETIKAIKYNSEKYEFGEVGRVMYNFIWDDFCSWYIELSKPVLYSENIEKKLQKQKTLLFVLDQIIRLLHPFMPYITEEIWQALPHTKGSISVAEYPTLLALTHNANSVAEVELLMHAITLIRQVRTEYKVIPSKKIPVILEVKNPETLRFFEAEYAYLERFMNTETLIITDSAKEVGKAERKVHAEFVLYIPMETLIDFEEQKEKLKREYSKLESEIIRCEGMLSNTRFVEKAPAEKIEEEKQKLAAYKQKACSIQEQLNKI